MMARGDVMTISVDAMMISVDVMMISVDAMMMVLADVMMMVLAVTIVMDGVVEAAVAARPDAASHQIEDHHQRGTMEADLGDVAADHVMIADLVTIVDQEMVLATVVDLAA